MIKVARKNVSPQKQIYSDYMFGSNIHVYLENKLSFFLFQKRQNSVKDWKLIDSHELCQMIGRVKNLFELILK